MTVAPFMQRLTFSLAGTVALLSGVGCELPGSEPSEQVGQSKQGIINGAPTSLYPAAVQVVGCTGTLIAPRVVVTAAHCFVDWTVADARSFGRVYMGSGPDDWIAERGIADFAIERRYTGTYNPAHDIALVRLDSDAPPEVMPMAMNEVPLNQDDVGLEVTVVGFGQTVYGETPDGRKRYLTMPITEIGDNLFVVGSQFQSVCYGDSGGPTIAQLDGVDTVLSVTSQFLAGEACEGDVGMTRIDAYRELFVDPIVSAWSGPCSLDGTCVEAGCAYVDPDCSQCGFEGTCVRDCEQPDVDCPIGGFLGESCGDRFDCESRICLDRGNNTRYCSIACDGVEPCPSGMQCAEIDGAQVCQLVTAPETDSGGCSVTGSARTGWVALLLLGLLSLGSRRRRSRTGETIPAQPAG